MNGKYSINKDTLNQLLDVLEKNNVIIDSLDGTDVLDKAIYFRRKEDAKAAMEWINSQYLMQLLASAC